MAARCIRLIPVGCAHPDDDTCLTHGDHTIKVAASWRVGIGGKTWSTGALACKHLAAHAERYKQLAPARQLRVLELGAGTGVAGLFAARCLKARVVLTDADAKAKSPWLRENLEATLAGGLGGGEHSVIGGGSASCCTGSRPGVPRSAG